MIEQEVRDFITKISKLISSYEQLVAIERNNGCIDGRIIGTGRADYTQGSMEYNLTIGDKTFALIDIPGIEGDESKFEEVIQESLDKAHVIFYVNGSGKKIEQATLEKVKKYMHDGTSLYAIFNVHCKAKKDRIPGIDKTFEEDLIIAYLKQDEIVSQTENELHTILGSNYKGSLSLNGLLAFCGYAIEESGKSTIVYADDKNLRSDQKKYMKEYSNEIARLREDSHIGLIQNVIDNKVDGFEKYIYTENIKKLKNRIREMIAKIDELNIIETGKIRGFIELYSEFKSNCYNAKEDYIRIMNHIGHNVVENAFSTVKEELFQKIEKSKGRTNSKEIQQYFDEHKDNIINNIQNSLNDKMKKAQKDYEEAIGDARQRLMKDLEREQTEFEISLSAGTIAIDDSCLDDFKYNIKTFGRDLVRVGSLAFSGASVGSIILGVGTAVGALVGAVLGVFSSIWNFFASEAIRVNKAKEKLQQAIDKQIDEISKNISSEMKKLTYEDIINNSYEQICTHVEKQKAALKSVERLLNSITYDLKKNYRKVS